MSELSPNESYSPGEFGLPHMGEVITDYRMRRGWMREAFAVICGVNEQTVAYWENQGYLADMDRRIFLCKVLKIPAAYLGLTWRSVVDKDQVNGFTTAFEQVTEILEKSAYALYEDILTFAHTSVDKYSPEATYRFYKHQQELEQIVERVPGMEKDAWKDLLSRYYQHSTFIVQHHKQDSLALSYANQAVDIAVSLEDNELLGASLYRRSRVHLIQNRHSDARVDIHSALDKAEKARGTLKGSSYLLAAEVNSLYTAGNEKLKTQCRNWQDKAAKLIYKGKAEDDGTFLTFSLYAVHHERAKTLLRFALYYATDGELIERLKNPHVRTNKDLLKDARSALIAARNHLESSSSRKEMYLAITEARIYLVGREFEESARIAKKALQFARKAYSQQIIEEVKQIHGVLNILAPENPYVCNLGIEVGVFP